MIKFNNGVVRREYAHRLVALNFLPKESGKNHVNHKDGNKLNNHYKNLEWCTPGQNLKHSYEKLRNEVRFGRGNLHPLSKLTDKEVLEIREKYKQGTLTQRELAKLFGVTNPTIFHIIHRNTWKHI